MNRSQINVISNECGLKLNNVVSTEWYQMNRSQMNVVSNERGLKWRSLMWNVV